MRKLKLFLSLLMVMALSLGNVWAAKDDVVYKYGGTALGTTNAYQNYDKASIASADDGSTLSTASWAATCGSNQSQKLWLGANSSQKAKMILSTGSYSEASGIASAIGVNTSATYYAALIGRTNFENVYKVTLEYTTPGGTAPSEAWILYSTDNGSTWTVGKKMTSLSTSGTNFELGETIESARYAFVIHSTNYCQFKVPILTFYEGSTSSCSKTVTITKGAETNGTYTLSATEVCGDGEGEDVTISDITPGPGYAFDKITTSASGTVDNVNKKVTGITANTTITVLFKELQKYTVSFNTGAGNPGVDPITETTAGAGITLPAGPTPACSAAGWSFAGWAAAAVASETTTAPTLLSGDYKPTDNVTLYAVYKRTEGGDGAAVGTTLFSENFGTFSADSVPNGETSATTGRVIYGGGSVTYTSADNGSNLTKIYNDALAGGTAPELLVGKSGGVFRIAGIPSGKADKIGVSFKQNAQKLTVSLTGKGYSTTYASPKPSAPGEVSFVIDVADGADETFAMVLTAGSSNVRLDDISITVASSSTAGTTYYLSAPSCCTKLADIEGSVKSVDQTSVTLQWTKLENVDGTTPYEVVVSPNAGVSVGAINLEGEKAECAITNLACGTEYTFTIKAYGATGYCDAEQEIVQSTSKYTITPNAIGGGLVLAPEATSVCNGTEITLTANTPDGSHEGTASIVITNESKEDVTSDVLSGSTLTMPAYNITITATYAEKSSPSVGVNPAALDFGSPAKGALTEKKSFELTGSALVAGTLTLVAPTGYTVSPAEIVVEAGSLAAQTIYVTPSTANAGVFNGNISISGAGVAETNIVVLTMTVQETYTAKWFVNGEELTESTQTALAGTDLIVPTNPTKLADDCDDMVFKGWAETPIEGKQDDAPAYTEKTKMPEDNVNFYAVFASEVQSGSIDKKSVSTTMSDYVTANSCTVSSGQDVTMYTSLTLDENITLSTTGEANCGSFWNTSSTDDTKQWRLYQNKSGNATVTALNGYELKNVTITYVVSNSGILTDLTSGVKTEVSGTSVTYTVGNTGTATNGQVRITAIDVEYEKNDISKVTKDYMTTCQSCGKVNLMKAATEHGSYTFQQSGIAVTSVKTCDATTVDVVFEPAEGYELANFQISELAGVSYEDGVLTIAQNAAGNLTTTATFAPKNYSVTMTQTGYAEATLSEDQTNKHIGNEITISTNEPEGYYFVGWEATPTVVFANATAPNTTFTMPASDVTIKAKFAWIRPVADALSKIPNENDFFGGAAVEGYVSGNISYNETYKSLTYDIRAVDANGFLTGDVLQVYSGKGIDGADFSSENDIKVGAKVRIYGDLKNYKGTREFNASSKQFYYVEAANPSVVVYGDATKTAYEVGDKFDFAGLGAKTAYDNGYATAIAKPEWTAAPETIAANTESVSVTANGSSAKVVNVTVNTHAVTFEAPENGKLSIMHGVDPVNSGDAFVKGTVLNIEVSPAIGYKLATLTVNGNDVKAEKQFEIGTESQYEVVATFVEKAEAGIAWSAAEATAVDYEGAVNTLPTLTNAASLEVAYESTNTDVAEIAANGDVTIKAAGSATIKAIFAGNETYKAATVTYELTVSHVPVVKLAGDFTVPQWKEGALTLIPNEDYTKASVKVNFAANSWPLFKMIVDEEWRGLPKNGDDYYLFHRDWNTVAISDAGGDIQLKADFEGEYTFTWTYATNTLTITFPDMPEPEYYIAGDFTTWEDNMAKMTEYAGMYIATVTINATEPQEFKVVRVQGPYKTWYGLAGEATMTPENCTNWSIGGGNTNIGLQPSYAGKYTFYFNEGDMQLTIDMPTEPGTALDNTEAGEKAAKVIKNGQLLIIKNGKTFNAQGAVVK